MRLGAALPRSTITLVIALVLFFAVLPLAILSSDPKAKLSFGPSAISQGRVLSVTDTSACRGAIARRIVYSFLPQSGNEFRGSAVVCEESPYYSAQIGEKVAIRYLTRDPTTNAIAGTDDKAPPLFPFAIFPVFFLLVLSPLYLPQLRETLRARRFYKRGSLVSGAVVFVKRRNAVTWPGWPGSGGANVYVDYQLPGGGRGEAVVWCANDWLINQLSPATNVRILIMPDNAARGVLLEAYIR
jgi:hypothetical protein